MPLATGAEGPYLRSANVGTNLMPILFFVLVIVLIAQVGFWNTLGAILGAAAMMVLLVVIVAAIVVVGGLFIAKRMMS